MSPLAMLAKKVIEAAWLHGAPYDLASQAAFALESAQLLQSPETAAEGALSADAVRVAEESVVELRREHAENARLRERIAGLEVERLTTNEALDDAVQELRTPYAERARWETHPGRRQAWRMLAQIEESERVANALLTPEAVRSADKLTRMLAPTQALQSVEGEHYSSVHHDYRQGRDLPELGGVS